jgi:truncated hemoglobin YjbI
MAEENPTLYERLGGEAAVDAAVDRFYVKVLADTSISPFFEGLDMKRQARKQKAFLTVAFGGPNRYSDRAMGAAHAKAREDGLNDAHYDAVVGHLAETLGELGVSDADIQEVRAVTESVRDEILGR